MAWVFVMVAGLFEVGFAISLKESNVFSRPLPTVLVVIFAVLSLTVLNFGLRDLPVGSAYAVWTGIGATGTLIIGMLFLSEPATVTRIAFVSMIISGVIGLQLAGGH
ncbi:MAG TPA: multidrug efflux SMR transporter [Dehalococcoidia bacterium]|nr:multidrug efflux SMR transporter [Dehalococcoidia bacterium]